MSSSTTRISRVLRYNGSYNCSGQAIPVHFRILPSVGSFLKEQFWVLLFSTTVSSNSSHPEISVIKYTDDTTLCFPMYKNTHITEFQPFKSFCPKQNCYLVKRHRSSNKSQQIKIDKFPLLSVKNPKRLDCQQSRFYCLFGKH